MASSSRDGLPFRQLLSRRSSSDSELEEVHSLLYGSDSDLEIDEKHELSPATELEHADSLQDDGTLKPDLVEHRARGHIEVEHSLTLWQAVKSCPMAIFWCLMVSMCVVCKPSKTSWHSEGLIESCRSWKATIPS